MCVNWQCFLTAELLLWLKNSELGHRRDITASSHLCPPVQLPRVLRDWKEHGVSCPLALSGDHTVPHLSEQKPSTVRVESVGQSMLTTVMCKWIYIIDSTPLPCNGGALPLIYSALKRHYYYSWDQVGFSEELKKRLKCNKIDGERRYVNLKAF